MLHARFVTCDEMVKLLKANGWRVKRITGHVQMENPATGQVVPVPNHGRKELPTGTAHKILKLAGIKKP